MREPAHTRQPFAAADEPDAVLAVLCRRLTASDRVAFAELFRRFREPLVRYVRGIVRDEAVAHDLVQDIFVALWGLRETLDPAQPLKPYLYRMARNRAFRHLRDSRTHAAKHNQIRLDAPPPITPAGAPADRLDAEALGHRLRRWIDDLPERQREALVLTRFHDLSHRDAAALMGVSPRTVNNHIVRALESLHRRLQNFEPSLLER